MDRKGKDAAEGMCTSPSTPLQLTSTFKALNALYCTVQHHLAQFTLHEQQKLAGKLQASTTITCGSQLAPLSSVQDPKLSYGGGASQVRRVSAQWVGAMEEPNGGLEAKMEQEQEPAGIQQGKSKSKKGWNLWSVPRAWKNFKEGYYALRIKHFENLISVGLPGEVNLIMFDEIAEKPRPQPRFKGVRQLEKTKRWVSEIRPTVGLYTNQKKKKIWLGSFGTPEEAARAFDVGVYMWKDDQRLECFNFPDSPEFLRVLEPNRDTLDEKTRCSRTKALAQRAADRAAAARDFGEMSGSRRRDTRGETRSA